MTHEELQKEVHDAIKWEPLLHTAEIGVMAKDGIITLTGFVNEYGKKIEAENAAKKVKGVKAVIEKIEVVPESNGKQTDADIAKEVLRVFKWNWKIPNHKIQVGVKDGRVTLEGHVKWHFQKDAAEKALHKLNGVTGILNKITIKSETDDQIEKLAIKRALSRNASLKNDTIEVSVTRNNVSLNGTVKNWYQKQEAGRLAFNAPGVETVDNELSVDLNTLSE